MAIKRVLLAVAQSWSLHVVHEAHIHDKIKGKLHYVMDHIGFWPLSNSGEIIAHLKWSNVEEDQEDDDEE